MTKKSSIASLTHFGYSSAWSQSLWPDQYFSSYSSTSYTFTIQLSFVVPSVSCTTSQSTGVETPECSYCLVWFSNKANPDLAYQHGLEFTLWLILITSFFFSFFLSLRHHQSSSCPSSHVPPIVSCSPPLSHWVDLVSPSNVELWCSTFCSLTLASVGIVPGPRCFALDL